MSGAIEARARVAGERRARAAAARIAAVLREQVPGARIEVADGEVRIARRGLRGDPALRWPGGLSR